MTRATMLEQLDDLVERMGDIELAAVLSICEGIDKGREVYGELSLDDGRDFVVEGIEEARDLAVYLTAHLLRIGETR